LILSDSIAKYTKAKDTITSYHKGKTIGQLNDIVCFNKDLNINRFGLILIHAGTNDLAQWVYSDFVEHLQVQHILGYYKELRNSIRRRNTRAIIVFSAIIPRVKDFKLFYPYAYGVNFALEKLCAKSNGTCIFLPTHKYFLRNGIPMPNLYSSSDGLHPNGAGNDRLEARFQQALTASSLTNALNSKRTKLLASSAY
jgi:hypothetical protein